MELEDALTIVSQRFNFHRWRADAIKKVCDTGDFGDAMPDLRVIAVVELGKDLHTMKANEPEDWDGVVEVAKTHFAAKARSRVTVKLTARYQTPQGAARKAEAKEAADDAAQGAEEAQLAAIEAAEAVETATLQKRLALQTPGKR